MSEMADIASVLEIPSNTAPEQEVDISGGAQQVKASQPTSGMTVGDDSVFYSEEEEVPQQVLDSIWTPHSGEPNWPEKPNSTPQFHNPGAQSACYGIGLMGASTEHDSTAMLKEMESKMENKVNSASSTDTNVLGETAANSRRTHSEELLTPPVAPLRGSTMAEAAQMMERVNTYPDDSSRILPDKVEEMGLPGESSVSLEEMEEYGLELAGESPGKPFNHLMHAKYGTVSYRKIQRGQTRKKIEMFESMMKL